MTTSTFRFLQPLTILELANVVLNRTISDDTRNAARQLLDARVSYESGDYKSCAEFVLVMLKVSK